MTNVGEIWRAGYTPSSWAEGVDRSELTNLLLKAVARAVFQSDDISAEEFMASVYETTENAVSQADIVQTMSAEAALKAISNNVMDMPTPIVEGDQ